MTWKNEQEHNEDPRKPKVEIAEKNRDVLG
jgi:hypothetical protein